MPSSRTLQRLSHKDQVFTVAPSPTMRNRTKSFRDILLFIVDQNLLSVGDGLRSPPSLHKHRKNCEKEIMLNIMDNMQYS